MYEKSLGRFKFTLKDNYEFNYLVIIDIMYLDRKPILQVIDSITTFKATRFLKDMSACMAQDTLRACQINTYLGPLDMVVHNTRKNFISTEFKQLVNLIVIEIKEVLVEAHNSVGLVKRYYVPLRRTYKIIQDELKDEHINKEMILQIAIKAVNDSIGPNGIVLTLLVFGTYLRLTEIDPLSLSVTKRVEAICTATKEVHCLYAERQVKDALTIRNGPNTKITLDLPLQSDIRVWRKKEGQKGLYKLIVIDRETCIVDIP